MLIELGCRFFLFDWISIVTVHKSRTYEWEQDKTINVTAWPPLIDFDRCLTHGFKVDPFFVDNDILVNENVFHWFSKFEGDFKVKEIWGFYSIEVKQTNSIGRQSKPMKNKVAPISFSCFFWLKLPIDKKKLDGKMFLRGFLFFFVDRRKM